jgi:hypothetical protein
MKTESIVVDAENILRQGRCDLSCQASRHHAEKEDRNREDRQREAAKQTLHVQYPMCNEKEIHLKVTTQ